MVATAARSLIPQFAAPPMVCAYRRATLYFSPKPNDAPSARLALHQFQILSRASPRPEMRAMLKNAGLRPTRQRMALADILFAKGNRHVSAERLHEEALLKHVGVSLATVYNTLHQFTGAGLLREVAVDGSKTYFDTNISDHNHFYVEDDGRVLDIPEGGVGVDNVPQPPAGYEVIRVDVVIRLRRIR
jgi:Fur family iron response transcriptional regulator